MNRALLIVDIQNDFLTGGALAVPNGHEVIDPVQELQELFRDDTIVLTQDFHPPGHISFASTHQRPLYSTLEVDYGDQVLWPDHCIGGQFGADLHSGLNSSLGHLIIRKGTRKAVDSYSAFHEADGTQTGLAGYLKTREIEEVYICGLALDYCVSWTAKDAAKWGFKTAIVLDACKGIDLSGSVDREMTECLQRDIEFVNVKDIRDA